MTSLGSALDPINDIRVEANENVQLTATITAGTGSLTPDGDTAIVVIQDNDGKIACNHELLDIMLLAFFANAVFTIGFEPITYQVSEAMSQIDVCFEVEENSVLDIVGQAVLNTQSGSAIGVTQFNPH